MSVAGRLKILSTLQGSLTTKALASRSPTMA